MNLVRPQCEQLARSDPVNLVLYGCSSQDLLHILILTLSLQLNFTEFLSMQHIMGKENFISMVAV